MQPTVELSWRDPELLVRAVDTPPSSATPGASSALRGMMRGFQAPHTDDTQAQADATQPAVGQGDVDMACDDEEVSLAGALVRAPAATFAKL